MSSKEDIPKDTPRDADNNPENRIPGTDRYQIKMDFGPQEEAEIRERAAEEQRRMDEEKARKKAQEKSRRTKAEAAAKLRDEEWERFKQEVEAKRNLASSAESEEPDQDGKMNAPSKNRSKTASARENREETPVPPKRVSERTPVSDGPPKESTKRLNRKLVGALLIAALIVIGIWIFSQLEEDLDIPAIESPESEVQVSEDAGTSVEPSSGPSNGERQNTEPSTVESTTEESSPSESSNTGPQNSDSTSKSAPIEDAASNEEAVSKLSVGDTFDDRFVFAADPSGESGKIAYSEDLGPMPWKEAVDASAQLGEGWRLPTMDELEAMYATIGQGANNSAQFADELYWSATPYDENQARLLRFSDGNTSFHYNNGVAYRKFLVRPVRDFKR